MNSATRREALHLTLAALAPVCALQSTSLTAQNGILTGTANFAPPAGPMVLERLLIRELADGAAITVRRWWNVRFEPIGREFRIAGAQHGAQVDAPPGLEAFAQLEQSRVEERFLPLSLDSDGAITGDAAPTTQAEVGAAVDAAIDQLPANSGKDVHRFLASLSRSAEALISRMPRDLFFPLQRNWQTSREIALPGGETGEVAVSFDARMAQNGGVLEHAAREVATKIGNSQRKSREEWSLLSA